MIQEFTQTYTPPGGAETERNEIRFLATAQFPEKNNGVARSEHGTQVASKAYGVLFGLAKNAELIVVNNLNCDPKDKFNYIHERYIASLVAVLDDVLENYPGNKGKFIVNMSFGWLNHDISYMHSEHWDIFRECDPSCGGRHSQHGLVGFPSTSQSHSPPRYMLTYTTVIQ